MPKNEKVGENRSVDLTNGLSLSIESINSAVNQVMFKSTYGIRRASKGERVLKNINSAKGSLITAPIGYAAAHDEAKSNHEFDDVPIGARTTINFLSDTLIDYAIGLPASLIVFAIRTAGTPEDRLKLINRLEKQRTDFIGKVPGSKNVGVKKTIIEPINRRYLEMEMMLASPEIIDEIKASMKRGVHKVVRYTSRQLNGLHLDAQEYTLDLIQNHKVTIPQYKKKYREHIIKMREKHYLSDEQIIHYCDVLSNKLSGTFHLSGDNTIEPIIPLYPLIDKNEFTEDMGSGVFYNDPTFQEFFYNIFFSPLNNNNKAIGRYTDFLAHSELSNDELDILITKGNLDEFGFITRLSEVQKNTDINSESYSSAVELQIKNHKAAIVTADKYFSEDKGKIKKFQKKQFKIDAAKKICASVIKILDLSGHEQDAEDLSLITSTGFQVASYMNIFENLPAAAGMGVIHPAMLAFNIGFEVFNHFLQRRRRDKSTINISEYINRSLYRLEESLNEIKNLIQEEFLKVNYRLDQIQILLNEEFDIIKSRLNHIIYQVEQVQLRISEVQSDLLKASNTLQLHEKNALQMMKGRTIEQQLMDIAAVVDDFLEKEEVLESDFDKIWVYLLRQIRVTSKTGLLVGKNLESLSGLEMSQYLDLSDNLDKVDFYICHLQNLFSRNSPDHTLFNETISNPVVLRHLFFMLLRVTQRYTDKYSDKIISSKKLSSLVDILNQHVKPITEFIQVLQQPQLIRQLLTQCQKTTFNLSHILNNDYQNFYSKSITISTSTLTRLRTIKLKKQLIAFEEQTNSSKISINIPSQWWQARVGPNIRFNNMRWQYLKPNQYKYNSIQKRANLAAQYKAEIAKQSNDYITTHKKLADQYKLDELIYTLEEPQSNIVKINFPGYLFPINSNMPILPLNKNFSISIPLRYLLAEINGFGDFSINYDIVTLEDKQEFVISLSYTLTVDPGSPDIEKTKILITNKTLYEPQAYSGNEAIWVFWMGREQCCTDIGNYNETVTIQGVTAAVGRASIPETYARIPNLYKYAGKIDIFDKIAIKDNMQSSEITSFDHFIESTNDAIRQTEMYAYKQHFLGISAHSGSYQESAVTQFDLAFKNLQMVLHFTHHDSLHSPKNILFNMFFSSNLTCSRKAFFSELATTSSVRSMSAKLMNIHDFLSLLETELVEKLEFMGIDFKAHTVFVSQFSQFIQQLEKHNEVINSQYISASLLFHKKTSALNEDIAAILKNSAAPTNWQGVFIDLYQNTKSVSKGIQENTKDLHKILSDPKDIKSSTDKIKIKSANNFFKDLSYKEVTSTNDDSENKELVRQVDSSEDTEKERFEIRT